MASLLEKYGWHEWLCHTNFSFLTGASHPEEYVRKAFELNYSGLGIVDYDGVYGIVRAYRELNGIVKEYKLESKPLSLSISFWKLKFFWWVFNLNSIQVRFCCAKSISKCTKKA